MCFTNMNNHILKVNDMFFISKTLVLKQQTVKEIHDKKNHSSWTNSKHFKNLFAKALKIIKLISLKLFLI